MNNNYEALRQEYTAFCKDVETRAMKVYGTAGTGNAHKAALLAAQLAQHALTTRLQMDMQQEQAGDYDLTALRVDVTSASNSETGFEREE